MAPRIATKAAKRSSEEKTRRQRDGVNVEVRGRFVIIWITGGLNLAACERETEPSSFKHKARRFVKPFRATPILWDAPEK